MRTRIIDTNVLLDSPLDEVINSYEACNIVIPFAVLRELDTFKNSPIEGLRRNARFASRYIDNLRKVGNLQTGVQLDSGHTVRIELNHCDVEMPIELSPHDVDDRILTVAKGLQKVGHDVVLSTQDVNQRIIADTLNIPAEDFAEHVDVNKLYNGWETYLVSEERINKFAEEGSLRTKKHFHVNQYVLLTNNSNPKHTMLARYNGKELVKLQFNDWNAYGVRANNVQQRFLLDLLLNPEIRLVTAVGPAGTGKTLLALAAGLEQTEIIGDVQHYKKMFVTRSPEPMGKDHGYLPGCELDKMSPWLGGIFDNLEYILDNHATSKSGKTGNPQEAIKSLLDYGRIELRALTYIRGRSIPSQYIIIDEAQNLSKHEIKTIVSRAGEGTKVIVIGDIQQIDNPRLDINNNGLVHLIEAFKDQSVHGHITLTKTERGELADLAVKLL